MGVKSNAVIGTWNVWSMNQGKLEVVKQEMARVNIDISGISELKWTGMGKFNSDGRGWWWEKLGLSLVGRALLSKALTQ